MAGVLGASARPPRLPDKIAANRLYSAPNGRDPPKHPPHPTSEDTKAVQKSRKTPSKRDMQPSQHAPKSPAHSHYPGKRGLNRRHPAHANGF